MKYTEQIKIKSYDVDMHGRLRLSSLLAKLEELGARQMEAFPPSNSDLRKDGKAFLLSRAVIEVKKEICDGDVCEGYTFASNNSRGLSFNRYYQLMKDGEIAATVFTVWALLDLNEKKLLRVEENSGIGGEADAPVQMELPLRVRMPRAEEYTEVAKRRVVYSDTDINGHMNNTKYLNMLCDFVPGIESRTVCGANVSYIAEAPLFEELTVFLKDEGDVCYFKTLRSDGKINCEAVLYFK